MNPLDGTLKLLASVVELLKYREQRRQRIFDVVVNPTFKSLGEVHRDYLHLLGSARQTIVKTGCLGEAFENFQRERLACQGARREIASLCEELVKSEKFLEYRPFFASVDQYFRKGARDSPPLRMSEGTALRFVSRLASGQPDPVPAVRELDLETKALQIAWEHVCNAHVAATEVGI